MLDLFIPACSPNEALGQDTMSTTAQFIELMSVVHTNPGLSPKRPLIVSGVMPCKRCMYPKRILSEMKVKMCFPFCQRAHSLN
ncbi:hypothetical protein EYF80_051099 [Liparis tanakae]|uniref:Uncharacterized protein n=1 Tax=Liparis tanakae TaxID=230148 RepID=A0A4Z2FD83_9TELE|nr:hypothetical protein EYF80_051099 [Liparis tanakae]